MSDTPSPGRTIRIPRGVRSVRGLMIAVVLVGVVLAPLFREPVEIWALLGYFRVGVVVVAAFLARFRRGAAGDWWFGFAVGSWIHLTLDEYSELWSPRVLMPVPLGTGSGEDVLFITAGITGWTGSAARLVNSVVPSLRVSGLFASFRLLFLFAAATAGGLASLATRRFLAGRSE